MDGFINSGIFKKMVVLVAKTWFNSIEGKYPIFKPPTRGGFLLPEKMQLEQTQDALMQIEYDMLLERSERAENIDYPPHVDNAKQMVNEGGRLIPGCYVTQAAGVNE